jgi:hypothetical protein
MRLQQGFTPGGMGFDRSFCVATILRTERPLWVNNGHRGQLKQCPLYHQKRTWACMVVMSAKCQKQTILRRTPAALFDHLVGGGHKRGWYGDTRRLRSLKVDHQIELHWKLNGEVNAKQASALRLQLSFWFAQRLL